MGRIDLQLINVVKVVKAACVLHNMLCEQSRLSYMPNPYIDQENLDTGIVTEGEWRKNVPAAFTDKEPPNSCRGSRNAERIRDHFRDYFMGACALPWQENVLN